MSGAVYRAAELIVLAWVRLYLIGTPEQVRNRRMAEIGSDLYEQRLDLREHGRSKAAASLSLLVRCTAGVFDDLSWRAEDGAAMGGNGMLKVMRAPVLVALATAAILMAPLVAMQFSDEMDWTAFDFVFAGVALFSTGMAYVLISRRARGAAYRAAVAMGASSALLLVWVNGAVAIIGSENNDANAMYLAVLAIGAGGAIISRFQPRGMAYTLFAAAAAQTVIMVIALVAVMIDPSFWGESAQANAPAPEFQLLGVNGMFIALFLGSARLFQTAARTQMPPAQGFEPPRSRQ